MLKESKTVSQVCSQYSIHPTQAGHWKSQVISGMQSLLTGKPISELARKDELIQELYRQIGQLKVELDWLKKKMGYNSN